ncbi:hypothetical protein B0H16DRAFT_1546970 [Mycena metata]|uniref:ATP phosphoribosyltransferase catalytic domain-containing protein n=1 Tax=Mycena metata TaxID=1033252 RepID=A0AAD7IYG5_9AGAR|nr:hypothetical protein B0H16DRAFT_1546970 [Mycena metata]
METGPCPPLRNLLTSISQLQPTSSMSSAYTIVLHGNDATGKSTLAPALRAAGAVVYARGDEDPALEDALALRAFDKLTLKIPDDARAPLPESYNDKDGVQRRIVRIVLDAKLDVLQDRLAKRPMTDKWESEKALFYFRQRFLELATFFGLPVIDTGKKDVDETVSEILDIAHNPQLLALFSTLALRTLTPDDVTSLANRRAAHPGVDYNKRLEEIITIECGETSLFTPEDVRTQCSKDPGLIHALVNQYDNLHDANMPLRLRLVVEGESKQIYKVETALTRHFDDHVLVFLKPTIYSHSMQATAEIVGLSTIRATGSRLFLEMLHRAGISHTYEGVNKYGLIWARATEITPIETVYKELCAGTDKHSFFGMVTDPKVTLPTGQYRRGPYVRLDWRNPNHTYNGVNPATHPFYHLMEASVGKAPFYADFLTARAKPFGDKCVPEELVHGVQAVEPSIDWTTRIFFTIQHFLHQLGLEVQDGCVMFDPTGRTMWSEINQDCMRIKRREVQAGGKETFDKDIWRAGGSAAQASIVDKWTQLNALLTEHLAGRPFHEHEMVTPHEPYGLHARSVLEDETLTLTPRYRSLYERLVRSRPFAHSVRSVASDALSERLLARMQAHVWQITAAVPPHDALAEAAEMVQLANTYARLVGSSASFGDKDTELPRAHTPPGSKAIGVTASKYADKTDKFALEHLGVKLDRPIGRCLRLKHEVVDPAKFARAFGEGVRVHFVPTKPKDIPGLLAQGTLDGAVTYNSVMDNFPTVARLVAATPDPDIYLALISRRGARIDTRSWTSDAPARIAAEHVRMVRAHLTCLGVPPEAYEIQRVLGSSESYLVNDPREHYLLCDAVVSTGSTLKENDLDVWQVIKNKGDLIVGLYQRF